MNQCNPGLNDAFEKYFPPRWNRLAAAVGRAIETLEAGRVRIFQGRVLPNERIVEYPLVLRLLRPAGRVLDIGCCSSRLPIQIASLGFEVHGVDVRPYPFTHPLFKFHQLDFVRDGARLGAETFDVVTAVSTVEHIGLGGYGEVTDPQGDLRAMQAIHTVLKPGGQLIITFPYGRSGLTSKHRVYDQSAVACLIVGFALVKEYYFQRVNESWVPRSKAELAEIASPGAPPNGVAILECQKG
jgi:2-polyprenyl-3-methyl-5-hydroxy-6-metoxy-1,4-benzoquinol methylase